MVDDGTVVDDFGSRAWELRGTLHDMRRPLQRPREGAGQDCGSRFRPLSNGRRMSGRMSGSLTTSSQRLTSTTHRSTILA